jgi:acyl carrier protein
MDIKKTLEEFVTTQFLKGESNGNLGNVSSFLEEGIIDSIGVLELVTFIEETYGFRVEDEELVPENLDSINNLVDFINAKLSAVRS